MDCGATTNEKITSEKLLKAEPNTEAAGDTQEREQLIAAWIAGADAAQSTPEYEDNFWAWERLNDMACGRSENNRDAEEVWRIILAMLELPLSDKVKGNLAAGPLEDLLRYHGAAFIERVETQARRDAVSVICSAACGKTG